MPSPPSPISRGAGYNIHSRAAVRDTTWSSKDKIMKNKYEFESVITNLG